jgi:hypothetical protein
MSLARDRDRIISPSFASVESSMAILNEACASASCTSIGKTSSTSY